VLLSTLVWLPILGAAALLLLAGPIHVYCLCFILARYF